MHAERSGKWTASSGHPTAIIEYPGLQTVLCIALKNKTKKKKTKHLTELHSVTAICAKRSYMGTRMMWKTESFALSSDF